VEGSLLPVRRTLERPELSARELAVLFTEQQHYFVSESSVYRLLKSHDLITSPAFVLLKAADTFQHPTTAPNQLWRTSFTYLKVRSQRRRNSECELPPPPVIGQWSVVRIRRTPELA